jgi:iron complex transport system ATP-binding protein
MLKVENVQYHAGKKEILRGISADFAPGLFHVIVGPNGSGKSTFLKVFSGELKPQQGNVLYNDEDVFHLHKTAVAKRRAVMSQQPELYFPLSVGEIVMMGRYPHFTFKPSKKDEQICREAMAKTDVEEFTDRDYLTLSGGEKQRVQFARVLAQIWETGEGEKKFLFLDEAVSHLDLKHQQQILRIAKDLCRQEVTVIAILHDINHALAYADRILFMKNGTISYEILSGSELTPAIIKDVFDINARIIYPEDHRKPVVVF